MRKVISLNNTILLILLFVTTQSVHASLVVTLSRDSNNGTLMTLSGSGVLTGATAFTEFSVIDLSGNPTDQFLRFYPLTPLSFGTDVDVVYLNLDEDGALGDDFFLRLASDVDVGFFYNVSETVSTTAINHQNSIVSNSFSFLNPGIYTASSDPFGGFTLIIEDFENVPVPATLVLMIIGLSGIMAFRKKRTA